MRDRRQWVRAPSRSPTVFSCFSCLVGPLVPASADANPDHDIVTIELAEFKAVAERLRASLADVCTTAVPATVGQAVWDVFKDRGLLWPDPYDRLATHPLRDMRSRDTA